MGASFSSVLGATGFDGVGRNGGRVPSWLPARKKGSKQIVANDYDYALAA